jgi:hypothetical protein
MNFMITNFIHNQYPHYIIDLQSTEGVRNLIITSFVIILILTLGKYLNKKSKLNLAKAICILAIFFNSIQSLN